MAPCFTASASPAESCTLDNDPSASRSATTRRGWWNAPSRFFHEATDVAHHPAAQCDDRAIAAELRGEHAVAQGRPGVARLVPFAGRKREKPHRDARLLELCCQRLPVHLADM